MSEITFALVVALATLLIAAAVFLAVVRDRVWRERWHCIERDCERINRGSIDLPPPPEDD